jgi:DtxR family Mn-dependent transcriptional regulator
MMQSIPTPSQADHLKGIYHLSQDADWVSTNDLAAHIQSRPASVTGMIKTLQLQGWVAHRAYHGVALTESGRRWALELVRSHRLWEVFLCERLGFDWHEVHDLAEQLEHVRGRELVERLDRYLGNPCWDPHGDPIPSASGEMPTRVRWISAAELPVGSRATVTGMHTVHDTFLRHLDSLLVRPGLRFEVLNRSEFDGSTEVLYQDGKKFIWCVQTSENLYVQIIE